MATALGNAYNARVQAGLAFYEVYDDDDVLQFWGYECDLFARDTGVMALNVVVAQTVVYYYDRNFSLVASRAFSPTLPTNASLSLEWSGTTITLRHVNNGNAVLDTRPLSTSTAAGQWGYGDNAAPPSAFVDLGGGGAVVAALDALFMGMGL